MVNLFRKEKLTNSLRSGLDMSTRANYLVDSILRRALPGRCAFCLAPALDDRPWCQACFEGLPWNQPACPVCAEPQPGASQGRRCGTCLRRAPVYVKARVPLRYSEEVAWLVKRFKFRASPRAGMVLLALLEASLTEQAQAWPQALVPVPLHAIRARGRGFDQAEWLAKRLAKRLRVPLRHGRRLRDTPSQRGLDRSERRANLRGGFQMVHPLPPRVVLLDDVMTTGATLEALSRACLAAGAEEVEAWAIARTPLGET